MSPPHSPPRRLSGADALMVRLDRGNAYNHTLKVSIIDPSDVPGGWSWQRFQRLFEERIVLLPVLRRRLVHTPLGIHQPLWVDDPDFDLDAHLFRVACPAPGGMREFCSLIERVYARPLDRRRPLWELWVVEGLSGGRVGLVMLLHHAYTDGLGALRMVEAIYTREPDEAPRAIEPWAPAPVPSPAARLARGVRDLPATLRLVPGALNALRQRRRLEREVAASGRLLPPSPAERSAPMPFQRGLSRARSFACETFPLEQVRAIGKGHGVSINDVFLACAAGGVRRYLEAHGEPLQQATVGTMPLAVKPLAERTVDGNFSSVDYVWLHVEIADPVERLQASSASAQATKEHFAATKDADVATLLEVTPGFVVSGLAVLNDRTRGRYDLFKNVIVSNVPGPRELLYVGPWRLDRWFSTGQLSHGATVNLTVWSYRDQLNLCVLCDARVVADAWELVEGFRASLTELLELVQPGSAAHASTSGARP